MSRQLFIISVFVLTLAGGCLRDRKAADPLKPDTARGAAPNRRPIAPASRVNNPDDLRVTPGFEEPAKLDDRKTLPERREERKEKKKEAEAPKLPSPFAPKDLNKDAVKEPVKPAETVKPTDPARPATAKDDIRKIYETAVAQWDKLVDFEARLTRREVIGKNESGTEEVLFQYRKKPMSVYMRNTGEIGRNREVLYVEGQHDGKLHVVIGEGEGSLFAKTGSKMAFPPNSPLVTGKSRHKVSEAGFGEQLAKFGKLITLTENGTRPGGVKSLGKVERKEFSYPLDGLEVILQPGDDATLPRGGKKFIYFDLKDGSASYGFPVLIITLDDAGKEVEYYCFDRFKNPAKLTDADFSPDRLQGKRK